MDNTKHRVIAISLDNYKRLQNMGLAGESFNDQLDKIFKHDLVENKDRNKTIIVVTEGENDK